MVKVSHECVELIKALPEVDIDVVKAECLKPKQMREPTPKQMAYRKKFTMCAGEAKGKPDYRERMKKCLER